MDHSGFPVKGVLQSETRSILQNGSVNPPSDPWIRASTSMESRRHVGVQLLQALLRFWLEVFKVSPMMNFDNGTLSQHCLHVSTLRVRWQHISASESVDSPPKTTFLYIGISSNEGRGDVSLSSNKFWKILPWFARFSQVGHFRLHSRQLRGSLPEGDRELRHEISPRDCDR